MARQTLKNIKRVTPRRRAGRSRETSYHPKIRALVERQARAWERNDFDLAAGDWLPDGVLTAPGGEWRVDELRAAMAEFHAGFADLVVEVKNIFASADRRKVAIEWDWTVTRRSDRVRGATHDAIIVDLSRGKIKSWREYFDLSGSVEGKT